MRNSKIKRGAKKTSLEPFVKQLSISVGQCPRMTTKYSSEPNRFAAIQR